MQPLLVKLQELTLTHTGKPFIIMTQKTWSPITKVPMHTETGYIHLRPGNVLTLTACDPTGNLLFYVCSRRKRTRGLSGLASRSHKPSQLSLYASNVTVIADKGY